MIKSLHRTNTQTTPFVVTKDWELSNVFNDDLILTEHSGSPIALEFYDFSSGEMVANSSCSISLENQEDDKIKYRDGVKIVGTFYEDEEPVNLDGTFKRNVYSQIKNMFYNNYRDPTKMWGMEYIDFDKSQTKKFLSDEFRLYDVPTSLFGEKILENSVKIFDRNQDNDYIVEDDGYGNLFAGKNLFSKQQEVGYFSNAIQSGSSNFCSLFFS